VCCGTSSSRPANKNYTAVTLGNLIAGRQRYIRAIDHHCHQGRAMFRIFLTVCLCSITFGAAAQQTVTGRHGGTATGSVTQHGNSLSGSGSATSARGRSVSGSGTITKTRTGTSESGSVTGPKGGVTTASGTTTNNGNGTSTLAGTATGPRGQSKSGSATVPNTRS
jgi:hypothetical protein